MLTQLILACAFLLSGSAYVVGAVPDLLEHNQPAAAAPAGAVVKPLVDAAPVDKVAPPAPQVTAGSITGALNLPTLFPQTKKSPTADEVVDRVQEFYKDTKQLSAKFRQVTFQKVMGRKQTSDGVVYIKKPGKMRWEYKKQTKGKQTKITKSFISDGKQLWAAFHADKQFYKKNLEEDLLPVAVTFLYGKGNLKKDFAAKPVKGSKYGKKTDLVLALTPKKPSAQYKTLWLVVSPDDFRVTQSIVENSAGDTNHFRFFEPNTKKPINDSVFKFNEKQALKKGWSLASPPDESK